MVDLMAKKTLRETRWGSRLGSSSAQMSDDLIELVLRSVELMVRLIQLGYRLAQTMVELFSMDFQ